MQFLRFGKLVFALAALWLCLGARSAQAQVLLVDNLSTPSDVSDRIGGTLWQADAFQTDNRGYMLSSATLKLSSPSGGVVTVDLYSNTGANKPGSLLVTLGTSNPLTTTLVDTLFKPVGVQTLQPNTVYWLVAHSLTDAEWGATNATNYIGVGSIPPANAFAISNASGASWATQPLSNGPNQFRVTVDTPEPGAMALVAGLGAAGLYTFRRRRRQA